MMVAGPTSPLPRVRTEMSNECILLDTHRHVNTEYRTEEVEFDQLGASPTCMHTPKDACQMHTTIH